MTNTTIQRPIELEKVLARNNVRSAWARVRRNQGCAGVDGVSIAELEPQFDQEWIHVERAIRSGKYRPRPLLRVRIPKPSGGERLLGIPTVMDRVVQQSVSQVLSQAWEPRFSTRNFAYRPGRGPRNALTACERAVDCGREWILHLDIENFFDSMSHAITLSALNDELADEGVANLIQRTLACGVYEHGVVRATSVGLAQGSPLSPLLANIVLHRLDRCLESEGCEFARYADDIVLFLSSQELGFPAKQAVVQTLKCLGLRLNERKTAFGHFTSARFLGFSLRRDERGRTVRVVSPEALAEASSSLFRFLQSASGTGDEVAAGLAGMLRSWLVYFYTPHEETPLRKLVERIRASWREKFAASIVPQCLCWESLRRGGRASEHLDYSGHFQEVVSPDDSMDWNGSLHRLLQRLLRSRWWHFEYAPGWGRRPSVRLRLGRCRINIRF